jgi:hypothetical protein
MKYVLKTYLCRLCELAFHHCDKYLRQSLKGGKIGFGSCFQRFQCEVSWIHYFGLRQGRVSWQQECGRGCYFMVAKEHESITGLIIDEVRALII